MAGPAFAAKPHSASVSSIALESYSVERLGGTVGFTTTAVGLAGWQYPMVTVACYQNSALVYAVVGQPSDEFKLGGDSSDWVTNGGPANCTATLSAFGWKGGQEYVTALASTAFNALG
jgi:hypothetical protein